MSKKRKSEAEIELIELANYGMHPEADYIRQLQKKYNGTYHACPHYHYLIISNKDEEFKYCKCEKYQKLAKIW